MSRYPQQFILIHFHSLENHLKSYLESLKPPSTTLGDPGFPGQGRQAATHGPITAPRPGLEANGGRKGLDLGIPDASLFVAEAAAGFL